jgi:hypothetical protein
MNKYVRLWLLILLCLLVVGAAPRKGQKKVSLTDFGVPAYPGVQFELIHDPAPGSYLFKGTIPREKADKVFNFYTKRLTSLRWERDDELLTGGEPREKDPYELRYAAFEKYKPEMLLFLEISKSIKTRKDSGKRALIYIYIIKTADIGY